jgi:membrane-bound lytic murein transglycosylase D
MVRVRLIAGVLLAAASSGSWAPAAESFPLDERLRPRVQFWTLIYSRITTDQVVLHDAEDLGVIYQVVNLEGRNEWRDIEKFVQPIRERYADILRSLADATAAPDQEASTIQARFGVWVTSDRLRRAADNVRAQRGQADAFLEGLIRRGAYEFHLRRIFLAAGLPYDLTFLPHVESSFLLQAYSRSGAAGIWQFTRSTGRHFMRVSTLVDERWDPIDATTAAARLLKRNYAALGSWPLAITAYNHGLEGMRRAVARTGTTDLGTIIERYEGRAFGFASKNFYCEFLAAREVARNAARYFGQVPRWPPLVYQELRLDRPAPAPTLLKALPLSICDLVHYNPGLRPAALAGERPLPAGFRLKIPLGLVPEGASVSALIASLERPALRAGSQPRGAGAASERTADGSDSSGGRSATGDGWLSALPGPGPASLRSPGLFDTALLRPVPGGYRPGAALRPRVPPAPDAAPSPGADAGRSSPAVQRSTAVAAAPAAAPHSGGTWLGAALPVPLRLHPDWQAWMRAEPPAGSPPARLVAALSITDGTIQVEPEENLTLLAFWLRLSTSRLRQMNGMRPGEGARLGQRLKVDLSRVSEEEFTLHRTEYQRQLGGGFLRRHRVAATRIHSVRAGETLWSIARRNGRLPLWLLRWYNDAPAWPEPSPGSQIVIPIVERLAS